MTVSRYVLLSDVTITWPPIWSEIIQGAANTPVTTPAIPGVSGTAVDNPAGFPVAVTVTGGTGVTIAVNSIATGLTSGTVILPYPGTITLTWSSAPTWSWAAAELPQAGSSSMTAPVAGTAPPQGQAGTLPQTTFWQGTPLWLDPAGQLYAAIGGANCGPGSTAQTTWGTATLPASGT